MWKIKNFFEFFFSSNIEPHQRPRVPLTFLQDFVLLLREQRAVAHLTHARVAECRGVGFVIFREGDNKD